jgi:hypothetical protein
LGVREDDELLEKVRLVTKISFKYFSTLKGTITKYLNYYFFYYYLESAKYSKTAIRYHKTIHTGPKKKGV